MKDLAIIILNWNGSEDTIECLKSLTNHCLYDIYVLDNGSSEDDVNNIISFLSDNKYKDITKIFQNEDFADSTYSVNYIISKKNLGFAVGNNYVAFKIASKYEYILLLNNDTFVPCGAIEHMVETIRKKHITALTCDIRSYYQKEKLWNAGAVFKFYGDRMYYSQKKIDALKKSGTEYIEAEYITGCALMVKSEYIINNGLFTDKFFHGEEDFNFCLKLKQRNCRVGVDLSVVIFHKVGRSIGRISDKSDYGKILVYYCNRVIDFKDFYGKFKWILWREMYLMLVFIRRISTGMPFKYAQLLVRRIKKISSGNNMVNKALFDEIMKMSWE